MVFLTAAVTVVTDMVSTSFALEDNYSFLRIGKS